MPDSSREKIQTSFLAEQFCCATAYPQWALWSLCTFLMFVKGPLHISSVPCHVSLVMLIGNLWRSVQAMAKEDAFHGEQSFHGSLQHEWPISTASLESKSSLFFSKLYSHRIFQTVKYHCSRLSPRQSKDTSPMSGIFTIGIHSLTPCSHSLGTITSSQISIYLFPIF